MNNIIRGMKPWLFKLFHNRLFYLLFCVLLGLPAFILMTTLWLYLGDFNVYLFMLVNFYVPVHVTIMGLWILATLAVALLTDKMLEDARQERGFNSAKEVRTG